MTGLPGWDGMARILMILGAVLLFVGFFLFLVGRFFPLGRLPGDIYVQKGNFTFYFPLATSIILSLLLTLLFSLLSRR